MSFGVSSGLHKAWHGHVVGVKALTPEPFWASKAGGSSPDAGFPSKYGYRRSTTSLGLSGWVLPELGCEIGPLNP